MKIALWFFLLVLAGCAMAPPPQAYAREVKRKPQSSGVIALHQPSTPGDRALADSMMKSNCGGSAVKVLDEGEVDIGEHAEGEAHKEKGQKEEKWFGIIPVKDEKPDQNKTSTNTTKLKEWQIVYECSSKA
ncbi:MAG: hypothetical protein ACJ783_08435 [Myxococcales bacterium]